MLKLSTGDGFALAFDEQGRVREVTCDGSALPLRDYGGGFSLCRVAAGPRIEPLAPERTELKSEGGQIHQRLDAGDVTLEAAYRADKEHIEVAGCLRARSDRDHAVIVRFCLPINAYGWRWGDDLNQSRLIRPHERYTAWDSLGIANDIPQSRLPFCAVTGQRTGISLAVPLHSPRVFRFWYDEWGLQLAFDIGLSPAAQRLVGQVPFRFVLYRHDPRWGLRAAAQTYYRLYPELFEARIRRHGAWGQAFRFSEEEALDAGIVFSMGPEFLSEEAWAFARRHGIYVFKHREPWAWWHLVYPADGPRPHPYRPQPSLEEELAMIAATKDAPAEQLDGNDQIPGPAREVARAAETCFLHDETGRPIRILWHDWSQGWHSQIPLNTDPKLPSPNRSDLARRYQFPNMGQWQNEEARAAPGISWDSLTRWTGFHIENFRREHLAYVEVPPVFHYRSGKVVQLKGFHDWEMARSWCQEARRLGKYIMANTDTLMLLFFGQFLDCAGIERSPDVVDDAELALLRTLCYQKPFAYWRDYSEDGLQRALFYAAGPGNPRQLWRRLGSEAGRRLTRAYLQAIDTIGSAGWEPIPHAWLETRHPGVEFTTPRPESHATRGVERYGTSLENLYFTVRRMDGSTGQTTLTIDLAALGIGVSSGGDTRRPRLRDLITGEWIEGTVHDGLCTVPLSLAFHQTRAFRLVLEA
ncbi:MAG TPA: hypothetical protein VF234_05515 [Limnochordia bacterium]